MSAAPAPSPHQPMPRLGILGGGQLAKMTAAAATPLGCEVIILERSEEFPAQSLDTHALIGDWDDPQWALKLAAQVEVVTLENEFVNLESLAAIERDGHRLFPSVATMRRVQDKLLQKQTFAAAGLPVARFADAPTRAAVAEFGFPCVLKKRFLSYDGKGNATVERAADLDDAWNKLQGDDGGLYVEEFCPFVMELAIIVTRARHGALARYPVVETINRDHICHIVKTPAAAPASTQARVAEIAGQAVTAIDGVGSFGMECFLHRDGEILINEIAPRVHNTGHYTIEACACSQFENHVRAILDWPLGSPAMVAPAAVMVNLLGTGNGPGRPSGWEAALAVNGAHIHVYGKRESRRGRKMGHVTALGATVDEALACAERAAGLLRFGTHL